MNACSECLPSRANRWIHVSRRVTIAAAAISCSSSGCGGQSATKGLDLSRSVDLDSSSVSDLGHHDAAGSSAHDHHGGHSHVDDDDDDDDDGGLGMMVGVVPVPVIVLSLVLVPRQRPIPLTGRI